MTPAEHAALASALHVEVPDARVVDLLADRVAERLAERLADLIAERLAVRGVTASAPLAPGGADIGGADPGAWLSVATVALRLDRHVDTIRDDLRAGRLSGVKVGRSWRVRADVLDALLDGSAREQVARRADRERVDAAEDHQRARARAARAARKRRGPS